MFPVEEIQFIPLTEESEAAFSYTLPNGDTTIPSYITSYLTMIANSFNDCPKTDYEEDYSFFSMLYDLFFDLLPEPPKEDTIPLCTPQK